MTPPASPAPGRYTLLGADGRPYVSTRPGALGGYRRGRLYGRLDCPSARRAIERGGYVAQRVFFADEATALAAGYRPCAICLPERYARWRSTQARAQPEPAEGRGHEDHAGGPEDRAGHTEAELACLLAQLTDPGTGSGTRTRTVSLGHARQPSARRAAEAFARAWEAAGGEVLATVDWPREAASWLRPARRLTRPAPDAWVVASGPEDFAPMAARLRQSTDWTPARTYAFASLATPRLTRLTRLTGADAVEGLRGATADGEGWVLREGTVVRGSEAANPVRLGHTGA
ncbi:ABC transporter substrate-binding protein [Streptomyces sp. LHD-70]|uniref:Ada metal-binding domain-containing protein n=1 Tax=Streptomyces sp. LHD-70 TaxID=3072140 RepID=UPI00280F71A2|nr:Ada metal-binding domain-containing protein [Streptomyces sp. LHD-70]MDQ8706928.1 ABC transporter substrate-binding protein [Streptomyces sp. LHD-70]